MTRIICPGCESILQARPEQLGMRLTCPRCGQLMRIPAPVARRVDSSSPSSNVRESLASSATNSANNNQSWKSWIGLGLLSGIFLAGAYGIYTALVIKSASPVAIVKPEETDPVIGPETSPPRVEKIPPVDLREPEKTDIVPIVKPIEPLPSQEPKLPPSSLEFLPTETTKNDLKTGIGPGVLDPNAPISRDRNWFICYPADGQVDVPLEFTGNEIPDPLPDATNKLTGYPLTITFAPAVRVQNVQIELLDDKNQKIPCWISTPEKPANLHHIEVQANTICLFSHKPLESAMRYTLRATARVNQKPWNHEIHFNTINQADRDKSIQRIVLDRLNRYRRLAGLTPVVLDPEISMSCLAHARYLARNLPENPNLNWNDEQENLPGATSEGKRIARATSVFLGGGPVGLVDWMFSSFFNRHSVLDPGLEKVGIGFQGYPSRGMIWVFRVRGEHLTGNGDNPILFPPDGQLDVPTTYPARSRPYPLPPEEKEHDLGYAITVRFPGNQRLERVKGQLETPDKKSVACYLSTPEKPAVQQVPQFWIGIVPREPLLQGVTYTVHLSGELNRKSWKKSWSFTTAQLDTRKQAQIAEFTVSRLNRIRQQLGLGKVRLDETLSQGCRNHAHYLVINQDHPSTQGIGMHDESPQLEGFTQEGQIAGKASVIASDASPGDFIDGWVGTLYHRIPLLHPQLKAIGFGLARSPDQNWLAVLDCVSDLRQN